MNELFNAITKATTALKGITPSTITPVQLDSARTTLDSIDIASLLENYSGTLPEKSDKEDVHIELEHQADQLNKKIDPLKDALDELKKMRTTLDLEALDPLIEAGRSMVRKLYDFSASIQE